MLSIEFKGTDVLLTGLRDAPMRLQQKVADLFEGAAKNIRTKAVRLAPVGKYEGGTLRRSIQTHIISRDPLHIEVGPNVEYAKYVEFGRGWVYPIRAKALHWMGRGGKHIFARWARPAKAQPFMRPAIEAGLGRLATLLEKALGESITQKG